MLRAWLLPFFTLSLQAQFFENLQPFASKSLEVWTYTHYTVGYSNETRTASWSAMETSQVTNPILDTERPPTFVTEYRTNPQITHKDYTNSGYSRGHLTPNAIMAYAFGQNASKSTFITSNIVPQLQKHNGGVWEALESAIAGLKTKDGFKKGLASRAKHVWVYTGPYWSETPKKISTKDIWVPAGLWKTVIWNTQRGEARTCSWIIPHQEDIPKHAYMKYTASIKQVFDKTGIHLLANAKHDLYTRIDAGEFESTLETPEEEHETAVQTDPQH